MRREVKSQRPAKRQSRFDFSGQSPKTNQQTNFKRSFWETEIGELSRRAVGPEPEPENRKSIIEANFADAKFGAAVKNYIKSIG